MKRLFILLCLAFTLSFAGCYSNSEIPVINVPSVEVETLPDDSESDNDTEQGVEKDEIEEDAFIEKPIEKRYAVSLVDGLRVRSSANSSSRVLGYLDKNDAVVLIEEYGEYYRTIFKEKTAYVYSDYCSLMEIEACDESVEKAIELGSSLLGYPYVWGSQRYHWGNGVLNRNFIAGEFDCSALVQYVYFISNGVILDVNTRTQVFNGVEVEKTQLSRGDLMFFTNASRQNKKGVERIGHVGIYFGNNYILHTASDHAVIEPISSTRWSYYITARRVV